jgi:hypothetical protein
MNERGRDVLGECIYFASQTNSITSILERVTVKMNLFILHLKQTP